MTEYRPDFTLGDFIFQPIVRANISLEALTRPTMPEPEGNFIQKLGFLLELTVVLLQQHIQESRFYAKIRFGYNKLNRADQI